MSQSAHAGLHSAPDSFCFRPQQLSSCARFEVSRRNTVLWKYSVIKLMPSSEKLTVFFNLTHMRFVAE
jgi:hypothetical protein